MFGYVRVARPELRIREYEYYRAVYCGLCKALGKCGGQCARLTLSYDFAFMSLVRMALEKSSPRFKKSRCIVHPIKKRSMAESNNSLEFCAACEILLSYHKIKDDLSDEKGIKKLRAVLATPLFASMKKKTSKKYKELEERLSLGLAELSDYEKQVKECSIDRPAEIFGELLSCIMAYGLHGNDKKIASKIGRHVGKWIYIVDAIDDYQGDVKANRYNPIISLCGKEGLDEPTCLSLESALKNELIEAEKAFDLIDYTDRDMKEIVSNIIYLGMPGVAKEIINKLPRKEIQ